MARAALLQGVFQLAQQLALVLGELDRRLHGDVAVQVAGVAGAHAFDALAAQAELFAGLGAFADVDGRLARGGGAPSFSPPSAAVMKLTGPWQCRSSPSRSKMSCFFSRISMYRSPGGPPLVPCSPLPVLRMRMPPSMPAGILTSSVFCFLILPWPWQVMQGSGMILPVPRQCGQVCCTLKTPWRLCTVPTAPQVPQTLALVPGLAPLPWQATEPSHAWRRISAH